MRHKFQTFGQQIEGLDPDIFHRLPRENESHVGSFNALLNALGDVTPYSQYTAIFHSLNKITSNLPLLLYHVDTVVSVLLDRLTADDVNPLVIDPILQLICSAAKHLRESFYPYFPRVLRGMISVLEPVPSDTQLIDTVFSSIGFLFKHCRIQLLDDIAGVFSVMLPLLSHGKEYYRSFAAIPFAYLIRKLDETVRLSIIRDLLSVESDNELLSNGLACTLYQATKGVHSRVGSIWADIISVISIRPTTVIDALSQLCKLHNGKHPQRIQRIWNLLMKQDNPTQDLIQCVSICFNVARRLPNAPSQLVEFVTPVSALYAPLFSSLLSADPSQDKLIFSPPQNYPEDVLPSLLELQSPLALPYLVRAAPFSIRVIGCVLDYLSSHASQWNARSHAGLVESLRLPITQRDQRLLWQFTQFAALCDYPGRSADLAAIHSITDDVNTRCFAYAVQPDANKAEVLSIFQQNPTNEYALMALSSCAPLQDHTPLLAALRHHNRKTRYYALKLFPGEAFARLARISSQNVRDAGDIRLVNALILDLQVQRVEPQFLRHFIAALFGTFYSKLSLFWPSVQAALKVHSGTKDFWDEVSLQLCEGQQIIQDFSDCTDPISYTLQILQLLSTVTLDNARTEMLVAIFISQQDMQNSILVGWLRVFASCKSITSQPLYDRAFSALQKANYKVQRAALVVLLKFKAFLPLQNHRDSLLGFLDKRAISTQLATFSPDSIAERGLLMRLLIPILHSKMFSQRQSRPAILAYCCLFNREELSTFIDMLLQPFTEDLLDDKKIQGLLTLAPQVARGLGANMYPFADLFNDVLVSIINSDSTHKHGAIRVLSVFVQLLPAHDFRRHLMLIDDTLKSHIQQLFHECAQSPSAVFNLLNQCVHCESLKSYLDSNSIGALLSCLVYPHCAPELLKFTSTLLDIEGGVALVPHLDLLLESLLGNRHLVRHFFLLKRIAPLASDIQCRSVIVLLLGMMKTERRTSELLDIIDACCARVASQDLSFVVYPLSEQFLRFGENRDLRERLCVTFSHLSIPELAHVIPVIKDMNSYSLSQIGGENGAIRIRGFETAAALLSNRDIELPRVAVLPLLHNYLHFVQSTDFALRELSVQGLQLLFASSATEGAPSQLVETVVFPFLKKKLAHCDQSVGSSCMAVLRALVRAYRRHYGDLAILLNDSDEEQDFYTGVFHMQVQRRIGSMHTLRHHLNSNAISVTSLNRIFNPMFLHLLQHEAAKRSVKRGLVLEGIAVLGQISAHLSWKHYRQTLQAVLKEPLSDSDSQVQLICAILDGFHFDTGEEKIQELLVKRVLKSLERDLRNSTKKGEQEDVSPRLPVALAIIKVLKLLPDEKMHHNLPRISRALVTSLASRDEAVRNDTRSIFCTIAQQLGASYFPQLLRALKSVLRRGFMLQVLPFTIHYTLFRMKLSPGDLDSSIDQLASIFLEDILGETAQKKKVDLIAARYLEARFTKSFESYSMISRIVSRDGFRRLMQPVIDLLAMDIPMEPVREIFTSCVKGLARNSAVDLETFLIYCYGYIEQKPTDHPVIVAEEEHNPGLQYRMEREQKNMIVEKTTRASVEFLRNQSNHFDFNKHLLSEFGLQLLHSWLRKKKFDTADTDHMRRLDPFVALLGSCMSSPHDLVVLLACKCLKFLVCFNDVLPSVSHCTPAICSQALDLMQRLDVGSELHASLVGLLTSSIKFCKSFNPTERQVLVLLSLVSEELNISTLALLGAILDRRIPSAELYSVMTKVYHEAIAGASAQCRRLVVTFLIHYPLAKKKLRQHMEQIVVDLGFDQTTGRESALELIHSVFIRFPESVIGEFAHTLFLPLAMRLTQEDDRMLRAMVGAALKALFSRLEDASSLADLALSWIDLEQASITTTAVQTLGIMLECSKVNAPQLKRLVEYVTGYLDALTAESDEDVHVYQCMTTLEKADVILSSIWEDEGTFHKLMMYPHDWVRQSASRMLGRHLVNVHNGEKPPCVLLGEDGDGSAVFSMIQLCCKQLSDMEGPCPTGGEQTLNNLLFLVRCAYEHSEENPTRWVFSRLSYISRGKEAPETLRLNIFAWFAKMCLKMTPKDAQEQLVSILNPLYRVMEAPVEERNPIIDQVVLAIKNHVGVQPFVRQFQFVKDSVNSIRRKRKVVRVTERIKRPHVAAAKRKRKRHKDKEKRKLEQL